MILGIELDNVLCDLAGGISRVNHHYYNGNASADELKALPDLVPDFYRDLEPVPGVIGDLLRVAAHDPRLEVVVVSSRPDRFFTESKNWLRRWLPERVLPWTLNNTPDFSLIRAPQTWVVTDARRLELGDAPSVVSSVEELGYGVQERLQV